MWRLFWGRGRDAPMTPPACPSWHYFKAARVVRRGEGGGGGGGEVVADPPSAVEKAERATCANCNTPTSTSMHPVEQLRLRSRCHMAEIDNDVQYTRVGSSPASR